MDTKKLRQKILDLAIRGKLVPQDPNDEPASLLLERIRAEKERLIKEGKIKRSKKTAEDDKIEAPFEIPESWEWTKLGEISDYGTTINVDVKDIPQNVWVLELEDLERDSATIIKRVTKGEREIKGVRHSFKKGDVLYSKLRTYLNKVLVAPDNGYCTTEIIPISFYSGVQPEFLNNVLRSRFFLDYTIQCGYGVKMPRLSTTDACNGLIPLPPLAEQKRITNEIERWFTLIDELESNEGDLLKAIDKAKSKILDLAIHGKLVPQDPNDEPASVLLERIRAEKERLIKERRVKRSKGTTANDNIEAPFEIPRSWEWCRLDDLAFYKKGPFGSSLTKSMFVPDSPNAFKVYEQKNAINKDASLGYYFIDAVKYEELIGFAVSPSDIIVSCAGTIGETYVLPKNIREGIINQALMLIRLYEIDITDFYLLYFDFILKNEASKESKGTAIKNIPPFDVLKNYQIPIPPLAEQKRIVAKIEEVFKALDALS